MKNSDKRWIEVRFKEHSGMYSVDTNHRIVIHSIYSKPFYYIWYLNVLLYFKWLKRQIIKWFKSVTQL